MTSDSETLRRAAREMREKARAVRAGADEPNQWFCAEEIVSEFMWGDQPQHGDVQADAEHIAAWHPDVALAVADLLDGLAADCEHWDFRHDEGLAVARTFLGPDAGEEG